MARLVVHYGRIVEHAQSGHVVVIAGHHARMLFEEECGRNVQRDGQRLQYKAGQGLEVIGQCAYMIRKSGQRLLWQILDIQCANVECMSQLRCFAIEALVARTHIAVIVAIAAYVELLDIRFQVDKVVQMVPSRFQLKRVRQSQIKHD